jgi:hypothetical protein
MKRDIEAMRCEFQYSGVGAALLALAAGATCVLVAALPFGLPLKASLALLVLALGGRAHRSMGRIRAVRLDASHGIEVEFSSGARGTGTVRDGSFVAPWLTTLRWRPDGAWFDRTVLVLPDMLGKDEFRVLRVRLRWS